MTTQEISIAENTRAEWKKYSDQLDCVPDPMTIRTAELFLNGRSGFAWSGLDADTVWTAIDGNLHGLMTFFNMLMTRPAIPLIAYFETFHQDESMWTVGSRSIVDFMLKAEDGILVPVHVEQEPYLQIRNAARTKLAELNLGALAEHRLADLALEATAYGYDWRPGLGDLIIDEAHRPIAHFLLGGLIFGEYANAAEADHLIQSKRSGLFAALTRPGGDLATSVPQGEEELFTALKETCAHNRDIVRVDELPATPSVLADILLRDPPVSRTTELLARAIEVRQSPGGQATLAWFKQLRAALADGTYASTARRDVAAVQREANHRLNESYAKWGMTMTPSLSAGLSVALAAELAPNLKAAVSASLGEVKLEGSPFRVGVPDWIRNWIIDGLPFGQHRKMLLRWSLAQAEFRNISLRLKKIWDES